MLRLIRRLAGVAWVCGSAGCGAADALVRVDLSHQVPGQRMLLASVAWDTGRVEGQLRLRVPGCDQTWLAACWQNRPLVPSLSAEQRALLLRTVAAVPLQATAPPPAPGVAHYALAMVTGDASRHALVRLDGGASAAALAQAVAMLTAD